MTKKEVEQCIRFGNGYEGGKRRVEEFFRENEKEGDRAQFLKKEYGTGAMYPVCRLPNGKETAMEYNGSGMNLHYIGDWKDKTHLTWRKVSEIIQELMDRGEYMEGEEE